MVTWSLYIWAVCFTHQCDVDIIKMPILFRTVEECLDLGRAVSEIRNGDIGYATKCEKEYSMSWNMDMRLAPRDNTLLQLLILQDDHNCGFDDNDVTRTMGFNNFDNDGVDEWKFPGWSWSHDCIIEQGHGRPIGWCHMLPLPSKE